MSEEEKFPMVTFILSTLYLAVFLFTSNNVSFYENLFGFIPAHPTVWSLVTYTFIHHDITHILGNLIFLLIAGLMIERELGGFAFLAVYLSSGNISIVFDIIGRYIFNLGFNSPFIGGSGAIFGLIGVMLLIKPFSKVPSLLVVLFAVPFVLLLYQSGIIPINPLVVMIILCSVGGILGLILTFLPGISSLLVFSIYTIFTFVTIFLTGGANVSYVGHLGGVLGGLVSFFFFAKDNRQKM